MAENSVAPGVKRNTQHAVDCHRVSIMVVVVVVATKCVR